MWDDEDVGFYLVSFGTTGWQGRQQEVCCRQSCCAGRAAFPLLMPPSLPAATPLAQHLPLGPTLPAQLLQMLNWDWLRNQPAEPSSPEQLIQPGWWTNLRQLLRPPLLDPEQPAERLAAWIDKHTMRVHAALLDKLHLLRRDEDTQQLVLDDPYWEQLQSAAPKEAEEQQEAAGSAAGQAAGSVEAAANCSQA